MKLTGGKTPENAFKVSLMDVGHLTVLCVN